MVKGDIVMDATNVFYVVSDVDRNCCSVLYLSFNSNRDSVIVKELNNQPTYDYELVDESLINYAGELAKVSNAVKAGKDIMVFK